MRADNIRNGGTRPSDGASRPTMRTGARWATAPDRRQGRQGGRPVRARRARLPFDCAQRRQGRESPEGVKLRPGIRRGRFLQGEDYQEEENYQTNPILRRPAWKFANGKAKNEPKFRGVEWGFWGRFGGRNLILWVATGGVDPCDRPDPGRRRSGCCVRW